MTTLATTGGALIGRHVDGPHAIVAASERCREHHEAEQFRVTDDHPAGIDQIIEVDAAGRWTTVERIR